VFVRYAFLIALPRTVDSSAGVSIEAGIGTGVRVLDDLRAMDIGGGKGAPWQSIDGDLP
jgi:hypothetical protein